MHELESRLQVSAGEFLVPDQDLTDPVLAVRGPGKYDLAVLQEHGFLDGAGRDGQYARKPLSMQTLEQLRKRSITKVA